MKILMLVALCIMLVICIFLSELEQNICEQLNFTQQTLLQEQQLAFVVKSLAIDYCVAAKLDDLLTVETDVIEIKVQQSFLSKDLYVIR